MLGAPEKVACNFKTLHMCEKWRYEKVFNQKFLIKAKFDYFRNQRKFQFFTLDLSVYKDRWKKRCRK